MFGTEEGPEPILALEQTGGFWLRAGAKAIDLAIRFFWGGVGGLIGVVLLSIPHGGVLPQEVQDRLAKMDLFSDFIVAFLFMVLVTSMVEAVAGTSPGKLILGMRVVMKGDLTPCRSLAALVRNASMFFD